MRLVSDTTTDTTAPVLPGDLSRDFRHLGLEFTRNLHWSTSNGLEPDLYAIAVVNIIGVEADGKTITADQLDWATWASEKFATDRAEAQNRGDDMSQWEFRGDFAPTVRFAWELRVESAHGQDPQITFDTRVGDASDYDFNTIQEALDAAQDRLAMLNPDSVFNTVVTA